MLAIMLEISASMTQLNTRVYATFGNALDKRDWRNARVISAKELGTMSKNNLRRITLVRGPILSYLDNLLTGPSNSNQFAFH